MIPCVLTIGGTDPSGGAGLPADARACAAFGAHALPVVTAVVVQNTRGVRSFEAVSAEILAVQLDNILEDIAPRAVKIGMVPSAQAVEIIAERVKNLGVPIIVDPVFAPSSGGEFSNEETIAALCELLLPLAEVVTPNWHEAGRLLDEIIKHEEALDAARRLQRRFRPSAVIIKGGHAPDNPQQVFDYVFDGETTHQLAAPRLAGIEVRGTGCMLASAIAAQRANDIPLVEAVRAAKIWLTEEIRNAQPIGGGRRVAVTPPSIRR